MTESSSTSACLLNRYGFITVGEPTIKSIILPRRVFVNLIPKEYQPHAEAGFADILHIMGISLTYFMHCISSMLLTIVTIRHVVS